MFCLKIKIGSQGSAFSRLYTLEFKSKHLWGSSSYTDNIVHILILSSQEVINLAASLCSIEKFFWVSDYRDVTPIKLFLAWQNNKFGGNDLEANTQECSGNEKTFVLLSYHVNGKALFKKKKTLTGQGIPKLTKFIWVPANVTFAAFGFRSNSKFKSGQPK